jgi:CDP-glucose 4,6-dehydratase
MHYFLTGHTGFKGSWLTILLAELGHTVSGYSIDVPQSGLFERGAVRDLLNRHNHGDVRDLSSLQEAIKLAVPDVCIHLAAQPLVLRSYQNPEETMTTNVNGTLNFLTAVRAASVPVSLVITTDKVYRDTGKNGYVEEDPLGGSDPYSASKAMADILTQSWSNLEGVGQLLIARAGNVIGAYDSSENRLLPDINRAIAGGDTLVVRNSSMVRPWQHVLDCLSGYLAYANFALREQNPIPPVLNFGPSAENFSSVLDVVNAAQDVADFQYKVESRQGGMLKETNFLTLNSAKARKLLGWKDQFSFFDSVRMSVETHLQVDARQLAVGQVRHLLAS